MKGILGVSDEPLVSLRLPRATPARRSSTAPAPWSLGGNFVKVIAWYDNEWGYSCRVADLVKVDRRAALIARAASPLDTPR